MKRRKSRLQPELENYWPSFTDMISTIAIILFFLMFLMYINNIITGKDLEFLRKELDDSQRQLEASQLEISQAENNLRLIRNELEQTMAELEIGRIELTLSNEEIEKQREIIASSNEELGNLRQKLRGVALLRLDVLTAVKSSIEDVLGQTNTQGEPLVAIGDNGNIVINEGLVFDRNMYVIKEDGKALLDQLAIAFEQVLRDPNVRANIDAINVQGHTDDRGTGVSNRELGSRRANSVVNYMFSSNTALEREFSEYFLASSFSEYRPVALGQTEEAYAQNRRIEISIILKDSEIQNVIDAYLSDSLKRFDE